MPTYGVPEPIRPERLPWPRVVVRMILIILPGLLVGSFIGSIMVPALGVQVIRDQPALSGLIPVLAGLIAGVGVGLLLKPGRDQLVAYGVTGFGIVVAAFLSLFLLAQLRAPDIAPATPLSSYLTGPLVAGVVGGGVALGLWWFRVRPSRG